MTRLLKAVPIAIVMFLVAGPPAEAAGNLSVGVVDDVLYVIGDRQANRVIVHGIQFGPLEGGLFIAGSGEDYSQYPVILPPGWVGSPSDRTTVNGRREAFVLNAAEAATVSKIVVITGDGGDVLHAGGEFLADIDIDTGGGEDRVFFSDIASCIAGDLSINTGRDADSLSIGFFDVGGDAEIGTGHGSDGLSISPATRFFGDLAINTGGQNDLLVMIANHYSIGGSFFLEMGQGDDDFFTSPLPDSSIVVGGLAALSGGQGFDVISNPGVLDAAILEMTGFESP